ncbi:MAG: bifunctional diaminohydroxyphosphoribosylaminopyrimidine deaminase/5-amino-6-(5-phosphoribosylamino)uracil reductase RibD, partial [Rhizobiales bacterium]|nr:bifunctional diaminohydroxyphosphoribosylaminopyrimidine deaminase/5-amino-6-(5-phosphoribosylamino)uracil reductase RibD [Hyphomicrobiales bacterium]
LRLGDRGLGRTWPNPAVGAVVVRDGLLVGRGWTQPGGRPHAETEALDRAGERARGGTLYVTLEPCRHHGRTPPCTDAILRAGIARVVSAIEDPNPEMAGRSHDLLLAAGIAVTVGIGEAAAREAHAGHIRRVRENRPHVTLKLALSADERVGLAGRRPVAITGEETRAHVHLMRATHDAVLTGIGTVLADDPLLTCRLPGMAGRSPVRVVFDAGLRTPPNAKLVQTAGEAPVWLLAAEDAPPERESALRMRGVDVLRIPGTGSRLDVAAALAALAARGITRAMVEAGPRLAGAFVAAGLVDTAVLFRAPMNIGTDGLPTLEGAPLAGITASARFRARPAVRFGADTMTTFERTD